MHVYIVDIFYHKPDKIKSCKPQYSLICAVLYFRQRADDNLLNKSVESSGGYDEVTPALEAAGKTPANHIHVVTLSLEINNFVWISVL